MKGLGCIYQNVKIDQQRNFCSFRSSNLFFGKCSTVNRLHFCTDLLSSPKGPSTKDVRQNLGFSNHPPPLVRVCPNFQNHPLPGRPRPQSGFFNFTHFSIFTHFYFCSLKQSLLPNSCFYKV